MMGKVCIELLPALAETLGVGKAREEIIFDRGSEGDYSVKDLLNRLCDRYPRFDRIVFDRTMQNLTGDVVIFLNGHNVALVDGLETRLKEGDTVTFIPFIEGG